MLQQCAEMASVSPLTWPFSTKKLFHVVDSIVLQLTNDVYLQLHALPGTIDPAGR
jgi:hypothetical protein